MPKKNTETNAVNQPDEAIASLTYEQAFEKLEAIVERMSGASVPLEELMGLYEQGMALGAHCESLLAGYDARLEKVSRQALNKELDALDGLTDEEKEF